MYLGIEIGGTKLQLAIGTGSDRQFLDLVRLDVIPQDGAAGIRRQIIQAGKQLLKKHPAQAVGIGFGGPVDSITGHTLRSFQIEGWDHWPLASWCQENFGLPTWLENDSNLAGLGEARFGAGRNQKVVFYTNIGSGIGGALVIDGVIFQGGIGSVAAEIGHLRPGPDAVDPRQTVESIASGWGIAAAGKAFLEEVPCLDCPNDPDRLQLLDLCKGDPSRLTGKRLAEAWMDGNRLAHAVFAQALRTYGWAIGQVATLLAPNTIVVGGGIAQLGEDLFLSPLRQQVDHYVIEPLRGQLSIVAAELGEEVVLHGALAMAQSASQAGS